MRESKTTQNLRFNHVEQTANFGNASVPAQFRNQYSGMRNDLDQLGERNMKLKQDYIRNKRLLQGSNLNIQKRFSSANTVTTINQNTTNIHQINHPIQQIAPSNSTIRPSPVVFPNSPSHKVPITISTNTGFNQENRPNVHNLQVQQGVSKSSDGKEALILTIRQLEQRIQSLMRNEKMYQRQIQTYKQRLNRLQSILNEKETFIMNQTSTISQLEIKIRTLESYRGQSQAVQQQLECQSCLQLSKKVATLTKQITDLTNQLNSKIQKSSFSEMLQFENKRLITEIETIKTQNDIQFRNLQNKIRQYQHSTIEYQTTISQLERTIKFEKNDVSNSAQNQFYQSEIDRLTIDNQSLKRKIQRITHENESEIERLNDDNQSLSRTINTNLDRYQQDIALYKNEMEELRNKLYRNVSTTSEQIQQLKNNNWSLRQEIENYQSQIRKLQTQLELNRQTERPQSSEVSQSHSSVYEKSIQLLHDQLNQLRSVLNKTSNQNQKYMNEISALQDQISQKKYQIDNLNKTLGQYQTNVDRLTDDNDKYYLRLVETQKRNQNLNYQLETIYKEKETISQEFSQYREAYTSNNASNTQEQRRRLQSDIRSDYQSQIASLQSQLNIQRNEKIKVTKDYQLSVQQVLSYKGQMASISAQLSHSRSLIQQLQSSSQSQGLKHSNNIEVENLRRELQAVILQRNDKNRKLQNLQRLLKETQVSKDNLFKENNDLRNFNATLQSENNKLKTQLGSLNNKLNEKSAISKNEPVDIQDTYRIKYEQTYSNLLRAEQHIQEIEHNIKIILSQRDELVQILEKERGQPSSNQMQNRILELTAQLQEVKRQNAGLNQKHAEEVNRIGMLISEITHLRKHQSQIVHAQEHNTSLETKIQRIMKQFNQRKNQSSKDAERIKQLQEEIRTRVSDTNQLGIQKQLIEVKNKLSSVQSQIQILNSQNNSLQQENSILKQKCNKSQQQTDQSNLLNMKNQLARKEAQVATLSQELQRRALQINRIKSSTQTGVDQPNKTELSGYIPQDSKEEFSEQFENMRRLIEELTVEKDNLREHLKQAENYIYEFEQKNYEFIVEQLNNTIRSLQQEKKTLLDRQRDIENMMHQSSNSQQGDQSGINKQVYDLQVSGFKIEIDSLRQKIVILENQISRLQSLNQELQKKISTLKIQVSNNSSSMIQTNSNNQILSYKKIISDMESDRAKFTQQIQNLRVRANSQVLSKQKDNKLEEFIQQNHRIIQKLKNAEGRVIDLEERCQMYLAQIEALKQGRSHNASIFSKSRKTSRENEDFTPKRQSKQKVPSSVQIEKQSSSIQIKTLEQTIEVNRRSENNLRNHIRVLESKISNLQQQNNSYYQKIQSYQFQIEQNTEKISKLNQVDAKNRHLQQVIAKLQNQKAIVSSQNNRLTQLVETMDNEYRKLEIKQRQLSEKLQKSETDNEVLRQAMNSKNSNNSITQNNELSDKVISLEQQTTILRQSQQRLRAQTLSLSSTLALLETNLKQKTKELQAVSQHLRGAEDFIGENEPKWIKSEQQRIALEQRVAQLESNFIDNNEIEINIKTDTVEQELQKKIDSLEYTVEKLEFENSRLTEKLYRLSSLEAHYHEIDRTLQTKQKELAKTLGQISGLNTQLQKERTESKQVISKLIQAEAHIRIITNENENNKGVQYQQMNDNFKKIEQQMGQQISSLMIQKETLSSQVTRLNEKINSQTANSNSLQEKQTLLQNQLLQVKQNLNEQKIQKESHQTQITKLEALLSELKSELDRKNEQQISSTTKAQMELAIQQNAATKRRIEQLEKTIQSLESEKDQLIEKIVEAESYIMELEKEVNAWRQKQNQKVKSQIEDGSESKAEEQTTNRVQEELQATILRINEQNQQLITEKQTSKTVAHQLQATIRRVNHQYQEVIHERDNDKGVIAELRTTIARLDEQYQHLLQLLDTDKVVNRELQAKVIEINQQNRELLHKRQADQSTITQLNATISAMNEQKLQFAQRLDTDRVVEHQLQAKAIRLNRQNQQLLSKQQNDKAILAELQATIQKIKQEKKQLIAKIETDKAVHHELQATIIRINNQYQQLVHEKELYASVGESLKLKQLQVQELERQKEDLFRINNQYENDIYEAKKQYDMMEQSIKQQERKRQEKYIPNEEYNKLSQSLNQFTQSLEQKSELINSLQTSLKNQRTRYQELQKDKTFFEGKLSEAQDYIAETERDKNEMCGKIEALKTEMQELRLKSLEAVSEVKLQDQANYKSLADSNLQLNESLSQKTTMLSDLKNHVQYLQSQLKKHDQIQRNNKVTIEQNQKDISLLKSENQRLNDLIFSINEKLTSKDLEIQDLRNQQINQKQAVEKQKQYIISTYQKQNESIAKEKNQIINQLNEELQSTTAKLENSYQLTRQFQQTLKKQRKNAAEEKQRFQKLSTDFQTSTKQLESELSEVKAEKDKLNSSSHSLENQVKEKEKIETKLKQAQQHIKYLYKTIDETKVQFENEKREFTIRLTNAVENQQSQQKEFQSQIKQLLQKIQNLQQENDLKDVQFDSNSRLMQQQELKIKQLQQIIEANQENKNIKEIYEQQIKSNSQRIESLLGQITVIQTQKSSLQSAIQAKQNQSRLNGEKLQNLDRQLKNKMVQFSTVADSENKLKMDIQAKDKQLQELTERFTRLTNQNAIIKQEITRLNEKINLLESTNTHLVEDMSGLETKLVKVEQESISMADHNSKQAIQINQLNSSISEKDELIVNLKTEISNKDQAINKANQISSQKESQTNSLKANLLQKDSSIMDLKADFQRKYTQLNELKATLTEKKTNQIEKEAQTKRLKQELVQLQQQNKQLVVLRKKLIEAETYIIQKQKQLQALINKQKQLYQSHQSQQSLSSSQDLEISHLSTDLKQLQAKLTDRENELATSNNQLLQIRKKLNNLEFRLEEEERHKQEIEQNSIQNSNEITVLNDRLKDNEEQLIQEKVRAKDLELRNQSLLKDIDDLDNRNKQLVSSLEKLSQVIQTMQGLETQNSQLKNHNKYLESKIQELGEKFQQSQHQDIEKSNEINKLSHEITNLKISISNKQKEVQNFTQQVFSLKGKIVSSQQVTEEVKRRTEQNQKDLNSKIQQLSLKVTTYQSEICKLKEQSQKRIPQSPKLSMSMMTRMLQKLNNFVENSDNLDSYFQQNIEKEFMSSTYFKKLYETIKYKLRLLNALDTEKQVKLNEKDAYISNLLKQIDEIKETSRSMEIKLDEAHIIQTRYDQVLLELVQYERLNKNLENQVNLLTNQLSIHKSQIQEFQKKIQNQSSSSLSQGNEKHDVTVEKEMLVDEQLRVENLRLRRQLESAEYQIHKLRYSSPGKIDSYHNSPILSPVATKREFANTENYQLFLRDCLESIQNLEHNVFDIQKDVQANKNNIQKLIFSNLPISRKHSEERALGSKRSEDSYLMEKIQLLEEKLMLNELKLKEHQQSSQLQIIELMKQAIMKGAINQDKEQTQEVFDRQKIEGYLQQLEAMLIKKQLDHQDRIQKLKTIYEKNMAQALKQSDRHSNNQISKITPKYIRENEQSPIKAKEQLILSEEDGKNMDVSDLLRQINGLKNHIQIYHEEANRRKEKYKQNILNLLKDIEDMKRSYEQNISKNKQKEGSISISSSEPTGQKISNLIRKAKQIIEEDHEQGNEKSDYLNEQDDYIMSNNYVQYIKSKKEPQPHQQDKQFVHNLKSIADEFQNKQTSGLPADRNLSIDPQQNILNFSNNISKEQVLAKPFLEFIVNNRDLDNQEIKLLKKKINEMKEKEYKDNLNYLKQNQQKLNDIINKKKPSIQQEQGGSSKQQNYNNVHDAIANAFNRDQLSQIFADSQQNDQLLTRLNEILNKDIENSSFLKNQNNSGEMMKQIETIKLKYYPDPTPLSEEMYHSLIKLLSAKEDTQFYGLIDSLFKYISDLEIDFSNTLLSKEEMYRVHVEKMNQLLQKGKIDSDSEMNMEEEQEFVRKLEQNQFKDIKYLEKKIKQQTQSGMDQQLKQELEKDSNKQ